MRLEWIRALFFLVSMIIFSCEQTRVKIPDYYPKENRAQFDTITSAQLELGRKLFFDKRLSIDSTTSCMTCHRPELAFTDGEVKSKGRPLHFSKHNASTLLNIAFSPSFMFDKRAISLETQSLIPLSDTNEMGLGIDLAVKRLKNDSEYQRLSQKAFHTEFNGYSITRGLAAFVRALISSDSKFDDYFKSNYKKVLTSEEWKGYDLFVGKAQCASCHPAPLFTDHKHYDVGLESGEKADLGLMLGTIDSAQMYRFKTPTLRNIAITAPYFHNGAYKTLEEVLDYLSDTAHTTKDLKPVSLSKEEKKNLILFLHTLTDKAYLKH